MNCRALTILLLLAATTIAGCGGGHPAPSAADTRGPAAPAGARRILYYRNPMGLPDISPVPKKDAMGMDYVPVYEGEETESGRVRIAADRLQRLGVRTEAAAPHQLARTLRVAGTLQIDERRQWTVSPRFEGWVTHLHVATTGEQVHRGDALIEVYSPDLAGAQDDYRVAVAALAALHDADPEARAGAESLVRGSTERLRHFGIAPADLPVPDRAEPPRHGLVLRAEHDGVVIEKNARTGMRFASGESLYQLADLTTLWLVGSVPEQDIALLRVGQSATATTVAYPGRDFAGTVTFISPILQAETRTAQVRIELANHDGLLKPAMFASVALRAERGTACLAVPDSAILDTGTRQLVLVDRGGGVFEPREIRVGARGDGYVEVVAGLETGELVVVNGNFLIDAESNLRAAVGGAAGGGTASAPVAAPHPTAEPEH